MPRRFIREEREEHEEIKAEFIRQDLQDIPDAF
jgi:hypothetical protein